MVTDRSVFTGGLVSTITGSETFTVVRPAKSTARNKYEICPLLKNLGVVIYTMLSRSRDNV